MNDNNQSELTPRELEELEDPRIFAARCLRNQEKQNELLTTMDWKLWEILKQLKKLNGEDSEDKK